MSKLHYNDFNEYVKDFPEAETYRNWLTNVSKSNKNGTPKKVLIVKGTGPHLGIPGGYLWARKIVYTKDGKLAIAINDCDDGLMVRPCSDENEVREWMNNLKELAPFDMSELKGFGFIWE